MNPYDYNSQLLQQMLGQTMQPLAQQPIHTPKVNGRAGAEAFIMPPNSDVLLADQNDPIVWSVQTDASGNKTVSPFDVSPHKEVRQQDVLKTMEERIAKLEEIVRNAKSDYSAKYTKHQHNNDAGNRSNVQGRETSNISSEPSKN